MADLEEMFLQFIEGGIDEDGVYPFPGVFTAKDGKVTACAFAVKPHELPKIVQHIIQEGCTEIYFGIDRIAKAGQGTTLGDLVTVFHWKRGEWVRFGVIEYQYEPKIVKPVDWENEHWVNVMKREAVAFAPEELPINVKHDLKIPQ